LKSGICGVSDENPKCAVTSAPIRGQKVTLSCIVTYRWQTEFGRLRPGITVSASVRWAWEAGRYLGRSSADLTNSRGTTIGETVQVDVTTLATGNEIPSYNCTTSFYYTRGHEVPDVLYLYNGVSWTCVSDPVVTWCRYF